MSDINELIERLEKAALVLYQTSQTADSKEEFMEWEAAQALRLLNDENERLQDDLEHLGRVIANINDHHKRLQEKHRDAVLFLRSTLFNDGEAGSRLMEILSPTAAVQEKGDE